MYNALQRIYFWHHIASDVYIMIAKFQSCVENEN